MAIVSRRILRPIMGKSKIALERATKYKDNKISNIRSMFEHIHAQA